MPSYEVASAMLDHFVALCHAPGLQPTPQNISNIFIACAELRLSMHQDQVKFLFMHLLGRPVSQAVYQDYCNLAHSLAVMDLLDIRMFGFILDKLAAKHSQLLRGHATSGTSAQSKAEEARQLHWAAEWLKPAEGSEKMEAWSSLHSRLQALAPAPHLTPVPFPGQAKLYAALAAQRVQYKAQIPCGMYLADAVLFSCDISDPLVILALQRRGRYIKNAPNG